MALASTIVWEVRTDGADTNGGGFKTGASGTDWTQQAAAQYSVTDAVTAGTTTITSATASFGTDVVGNVLCISGGTGSIVAGHYEIISRTNATTIVVDRATGLTTGTGATLKIGGALLTLARLEAVIVAGNKFWMKSGTYTLTNTVTLATVGTAAAGPIKGRGYQTTRGDATGTRPLVTTATNSTMLFEAGGTQGRLFENMNFSNTAGTRAIGFGCLTAAMRNLRFDDCQFDGFTYAVRADNIGASYQGSALLENCVVKNCTVDGIALSSGTIDYCLIHGCTRNGVLVGQQGTFGVMPLSVSNSIIESNGGEGITLEYCNQQVVIVRNSILHNNTLNGIGGPSAVAEFIEVANNIFSSNGSKGIDVSASVNNNAIFKANAFYNNIGGLYGSNTSAGEGDITLSANPFTNAASQDFTLNATAGGGAALKSAARPLTFLSGVTTTNRNVGVAQNAYSAGGSGLKAWASA